MLGKAVLALAALSAALTAGALSPTSAQIRVLGPQGVNLWQLDNPKAQHRSMYASQDAPAQQPLKQSKPKKDAKFRAQWFEQPLDHFDPSAKHTFHQRYWVSTRHYRPRKGAPVIVLDGGETSGEVRASADALLVCVLNAWIGLAGSYSVLGHGNRGDPGTSDWWCWCCPGAQILW
jgi:hypothetical protein